MTAVDVLGFASLNAVPTRPPDARSFGILGDTYAKDCTTPSSQDGTQILAGWYNSVAGNFRALIRANGLKLDGVNPVVAYDQLDDMALRAVEQLIQRGLLNSAVDQGSASNLVATLFVAPAELVPGLPIRVQAIAAPNGPANMVLTGFAAQPVKRRGGLALIGNEWSAGDWLTLIWTGAYWQLGGLTPSDVLLIAPKLVTGSLTLYVRPTGNDATGDGSANTDAKAFATIQGALNYAVNQLAITGKTLRIQLGVVGGTYPAPTNIPAGLGALIIQGDTANQDAYTIAGTGVGGSAGVISVQGSTLQLQGVNVSNTGLTANTLAVSTGGAIILNAVTLSAVSLSNQNAALNAMSGGSIAIAGPIKILTNMGYAMTSEGSIVVQTGAIITLGAGFTASVAVCNADTCGSIVFANSSGWSGSATGKRYNVALNAVINTFGQGANWIPGSIAGTTDGAGRYN